MKLSDAESEKLRDIGLFGGLSDETLHGFTSPLDVIELAPGAIVFQEGDAGREMFVVLEGRMEVLKRSKRDREIVVASLRAGTWFGERSLLDVMPRPATIRAAEASRLLRVTAHDLDVLYRRDLKSYTLMVLNITREMSRQLRLADELLSDLMANLTDEYAPLRG
ncbi:MAG: cyclic nucleotide-binding domain-containing protein [Polyangiaceae bacterium]|nr:cyclic nucleotide-binding domain-containing protein [Polyangiaceae bacterium]NUQ78734.1 cyclic nucleotide-binding domain-containing protein [Polyangiaceae bacterium]